MTGLILLRVAIGWHFLYQGIWKVQTPSFSASGFLGQAKGPLAEHFYALVPDIDGRKHLDFETQIEEMKKYADAFVERNQLNEAETAAVREMLAAHEAELLDYLTDEVKKEHKLKEQFEEHLHKLDRLAAEKEAKTHDIPFQQKRNWDEQLKLRGQAAAWSKEVDRIWEQFKADLVAAVGDRPVRAVPTDTGQLELVDRLVTYSNIAIGVCLIAGLFTRFAALAGALFLAQIVAAQPDWPGMYPIPHPSAGRSLVVNKEFVEMTALVALGFLPTGRWAGLDFFVHNLIVRPLLGKKGAV